MPAGVISVAGVYPRVFRITIPGSADPLGAAELRRLLRASADFQQPLDEAMLKQGDLYVAAKLCDIAADINIFHPGADGITVSTTAVRPWPQTKGDWTENCTQLLRTTWVIAEGAGTVAANLIIYMRGTPLKLNQ